MNQEEASCSPGASRGEAEVKLVPSGPALTASRMKSLVVAFLARRGWHFDRWTTFTPGDFVQHAIARRGGTYIIGMAGTGGTGSDASVLLDGHTPCLPGKPVASATFA